MKSKLIKAICIALFCTVLSSCSISNYSPSPSKIGNLTEEQPAESSSVPKTTDGAETTKAGTSTDAATAKAPETTAQSKTTEAPLKESYQVGDAVKVNDLTLIYTASGEYTSSNTYIQPKDGNMYIFFEFYVEYSGKGNTSISYFDFKGYADGYAADQQYTFDNALSSTLSAGRWNIGRIYFEVPKNAEHIEAEYEYDLWNNKKLIFVYEGEKNSGYVPEAKASPNNEAFKPGDIIDTGTFKISYLGCDSFKSDNMFVQPENGNTFIYLEFEFENISTADRSVSSLQFECYADGKNCSSTSIRDDDLSATLSPGRKAKGTVAFQIPNSASVVEVEYQSSLISKDIIVFSFEK